MGSPPSLETSEGFDQSGIVKEGELQGLPCLGKPPGSRERVGLGAFHVVTQRCVVRALKEARDEEGRTAVPAM